MQLSVIIATFNRCDLLVRTLPYLLQHSCSQGEIEIVVVVDGSTDHSADFLRKNYASSNFIVLEQNNTGQAIARNNAVAASSGEILLFLDDDLIVRTPDLFRHHISPHIEKSSVVAHGHLDVAVESTNTFFANTTREWYREYYDRLAARGGPLPPVDNLLIGNTSMRRETFIGTGGFDEALELEEDTELGLRLQKNGASFVYLPDARAEEIIERSTLENNLITAKKSGRALFTLCNKHPDFRPFAAISASSEGNWWRRKLRQTIARSGFCSILSPLIWVAEKLQRFKPLCRLGCYFSGAQRTASILSGAIEKAGSWHSFAQVFALRIPALIYHHVGPALIGPGPLSSLTVSPEDFAAQVEWLSDSGYQGISASTFGQWRERGFELPSKPVILTFDDAYLDICDYALPVLQKHGFSATVFVVTQNIGGSNDWDVLEAGERTKLITRERILYWRERGFEFGAHSRTHPDLTKLGPGQLRDEISGSGEDLASITGERVTSFAYPYGFVSYAASKLASSCFPLSFSVQEGMNTMRTEKYILCRTMVQPGETGFDLFWRVRFGTHFIKEVRKRMRLRVMLGRLRKAVKLGVGGLLRYAFGKE
jgi:peptidoglycan/xylan/chitin deacetylase (PgdA/CDA1 family)/glycosyltransferase involved in cell wall biosynthesis